MGFLKACNKVYGKKMGGGEVEVIEKERDKVCKHCMEGIMKEFFL